MSTYQALYGVKPPMLLPYEFQSRKIQAVDELLGEQNQLIQELREILQRLNIG